jgi:uncharacterized membrane protein YedE/YeeE
VAERVGSLLVMSVALAGSLVLGAVAGAAVGGYNLDSAGLLRTFVDAILFGFGVGGVGLLVVAIFRSAAATAVIGGARRQLLPHHDRRTPPMAGLDQPPIGVRRIR